MSYLVLARKYRPLTFEDLVGQEHVATTLKNALEARRLAHAYIFSGPRGCGKTTMARLLAKALNCVNGPTPKPCGECPQCKEIASGQSPDDVLEIDGASNRGIDQIRELRDTIKYSPSRSRHRIYIIDEAHQITDAGFNALLKTLEEPPAHAVFMMATTEARKIPGTIVSRCQRFQLKPIPPLEILGRLKSIIEKEKIKSGDDALLEVARAAHGSLRDALSLLDQVIAYSPDGVTSESIRSLLGFLPKEMVKGFARAVEEGVPEKVLSAVRKAVEDGFDLFQLATDLLDHYHGILLWKGGARTPGLAESSDIEADAARRDISFLERALQILSRCVETMKRSESPRVTFELAALELAQKSMSVDEILSRLENLEKSLRAGGAFPTGDVKKKVELTPAPAAELPTPATTESPALPIFPKGDSSGFPSPLGRGRPEGPGEEVSRSSLGKSFPHPALSQGERENFSAKSDEFLLRPDQLRAAWTRLLEEMGRRKPSLETFLLNTRWEIKQGNVLHLHCANEFQKEQINLSRALLEEILRRELGGVFPIQLLIQSPPPVSKPPAPAPGPMVKSEDAEMVEDEGGESPAVLSDESEEEAAPSPAVESPEEAGSPLSSSEIAAVDPGIKKILDKFPGKLKKLEAPSA